MRHTFAGLALAVSLGLVACGGGDEASGPKGGKDAGADSGGSSQGGSAGSAQGGSSGSSQGGSSGGGQGGSSGGGQGGTSGNGGNGGVGGSSFGGSSGSSAGGSAGTSAGGTSAGGTSAGGSSAGGTSAGGSSAGGTSAGGSSSGGAASGGTSSGGATTGGTSSGGATTGGSSSGGAASGGTSSGGAASGGASSGGSSSGGATTGGSGGAATGGSAGAATGGAGGATGGTGGAGGCTQDTDCDDGVYCNGAETCDTGTGACLAGTTVTCGNVDNATCTLDICSEAAKGCVSVPQDTLCSNGMFCDGVERCDPQNSSDATGCVAGTAPNCDDGFTCTSDSCVEGSGCVHTGNDNLCSNGQYCDGVETCSPGAPGSDAQGCLAGAPVVCTDNINCTTDSCDETNDTCKFTANDSFCDDGVYCNGAETCATNGAGDADGCLVPSPIVCNDNVSCTDDTCDEQTAGCIFTPNQGKCASGQACLPSGCVAGTACSTDAQCDDGDPCTVGESCNMGTGLCVPGVAKDCSDGLYCTLDSCEAGTGTCLHAPQNIRCGNSTVCDGTETCAPSDPNADSDGCIDGTPLDCTDAYSCTTNTCDPIAGCQVTPDDGVCTDGMVCNGVERCVPGSGSDARGCVAGTPLVCPDDGVACTTQMCSDTANGCVAIPDDDLCTGTDTCDPVQGCGNYCIVRECQGKVYACGDCLDNDNDGDIDARDTSCLGSCDNNEEGYKGEIPGQNAAPCKSDCYFDGDSGAGNDDCYWSHECDTHEISPNYDPEGKKCQYDPGASLPGSSMSCSEALQTQSNACLSYCGPLTPNGCDCFGCCAIPGASTTVYLGSEDNKGDGTCTPDALNDPTKCRPCDQVPACLNTCEECEICVGKPNLPPQCTVQECDPGHDPCGQPGQAECPIGEFCVTGCCYPTAG